jgi:small-conductance mechanosensitive channel
MTQRSGRSPILAALIVVAGILLGTGSAAAAGPHLAAGAAHPLVPEQIPADQVPGLVSTMTDAEARAALLEELHRRATEPPRTDASLALLADRFRMMRQRAQAVLSSGPELIALPAFVFTRLGVAGEPDGPPLLKLFGVLLVLAAALCAELLFRALTRSTSRRLSSSVAETPALRLGFLLLKCVLGLGAVVVFGIVAVAVALTLDQDHSPMRLLLVSLIAAIVVARLFGLVSSFVLAPRDPALRLSELSTDTARYLHSRIALAGGMLAGAWATQYLLREIGAPSDAGVLLRLAAGVVLTALLISMVLHLRPGVAEVIRGNEGETGAIRLRRLAGDLWHVVVIAYLAILWLFWAGDVLLGLEERAHTALLGLALLAVAPMLDGALRVLVSVVTPEHEKTWTRLLPAIRITLAALLIGIALAVLVDVFGLPVVHHAGSLGALLLHTGTSVGVTMLLAVITWRLVRASIDRHLGPPPAAGEEATPASRIQTLLPMVRATLFAALVIISVMFALSALGFNIGPLLAGAGVVGLAIGFGAQTLVRDILTGMFFLLEDAFRVGEYVEFGSIRGTVEAISVRSLRLRHHRGAVHTVPFGQIHSLTNYSRDWLIDKLEFGVTYDSDVEKVNKLIKQVGKEMLQNPELAAAIIEPLKSQGVARMGDFAIVIRAKVKSRPGQQFLVRREAYRRVKASFDANGVKFAFPTVTIAGRGASRDVEAAAAEVVAFPGPHAKPTS